jgi:hypothetical protein
VDKQKYTVARVGALSVVPSRFDGMFDIEATSSPGATAGVALENTDPTTLADLDLVAYAQALERQVAHTTALSLRASLLVAERAEARARGQFDTHDGLGPITPVRADVLAYRAGAAEVQQALRLSPPAAHSRLHRASALAGRLAPAGAALHAGQLTSAHLYVLMEHTDGLPDKLVGLMQARCLPRAPIQTPGNFGKSLTRARHALDPKGAARAQRKARTRAGVRVSDDQDGMSALVVTATSPDAAWGYTILDTLARAELHRRQHATGQTTDTTEDGVPTTPPQAADDPEGNGVLGTPPTTASEPSDNDEAAATPSHHLSSTADANGVPRTPPQQGDTPDRDGVLPTPSPESKAEAEPDADTDGVGGTPSGCPHPIPTLDQLRSQVFLDLLARAVHDPTFPTEHRKRRIETQIVIDLPTLLGLRDNPATINGQSVPGPIARELATDTTVLRRLVTDPVTGHLLDYGDRYQPPAALTEFLIARDQTCRVPHCNVRAAACDLDHVKPASQRGPTSSANMGALSRGHHSAKTARLTDIIDSHPDGSATYITTLGQRIHIPPRPVLEPPAPEPPEEEPTKEEPEDGPLPF